MLLHHNCRDFVFPILFDDTGNWQRSYMGYAWYVFSYFCFKVFVGVVFGNGHIHGEVTYTEDFEAINNILLPLGDNKDTAELTVGEGRETRRCSKQGGLPWHPPCFICRKIGAS